MNADLTFRVPDGQIRALAEQLSPKRVRRVVVSAVTDAARSAEVALNRAARGVLPLSRADVDRLITRRTVRESEAEFAQRVRVDREPVPLKRYAPKQAAAGVTVKLFKGRPRELIRGAFGPGVPRLGDHVFKRVGRGRMPIRRLAGPTVIGAIARQPGRLDAIAAAAADRLRRRVVSKLEFEVGRRAAAAATPAEPEPS